MIDVSIIVPVYNVELYLRDCINSILEQTMDCDKYEIILVNDGSTDQSCKIAQEYKDKYENIILVSQENKGLSAARNTGMKYAKGKYIYFCDSDDYIDKNLIKKCFSICEEKSLDIIYFDAESFYADGFKERDKHHLEEFNRKNIIKSIVFKGSDFFNSYYIHGGYKAPVWIAFYNRNFLINNNLNFTEGLLHEDEEFTFKSLFLANRVSYIPDCLFMRRIRENSILTSRISEKNVFSLLYVMRTNLSFIFKNGFKIDYIMKKYFNDYYGQIRDIIFDNQFDDSVIKKYIGEYFQYCIEMDNGKIGIDLVVGLYRLLCNIKKRCRDSNDYSIMNYYEEMVSRCFSIVDSGDLSYIFDKCKTLQLEKLELDKPDKTIGIYGIGGHTAKLMNEFRIKVGAIKSNIIFIDSYKKSNTEEFENRRIINVTDINKYDFDLIILSSYSYQNEMLNRLKELLEFNVRIIELYDKENSMMLFGNDPLSSIQ